LGHSVPCPRQIIVFGHEKGRLRGGLRRPFSLCFYFTKPTPFTMPTIFRRYLHSMNGVKVWCWRLRHLTAFDLRGCPASPLVEKLPRCGRRVISRSGRMLRKRLAFWVGDGVGDPPVPGMSRRSEIEISHISPSGDGRWGHPALDQEA